MALNDLHGEPVSTPNRRSLDRFEHAADLLSGLFADPLAVIDEALEEDPGFVMGHCMRAGLMLMAADRVNVVEGLCEDVRHNPGKALAVGAGAALVAWWLLRDD